MANRYANLVPANKIKDDFTRITTGFDNVQTEMDARIAKDTDLQTQITAEQQARIAADAAHAASGAAHNATAIVFTPGSSGMVATNVDAGLKELDARVDTLAQGGGPGKDLELVDIRTPVAGYTPTSPIVVAGDAVRDLQKKFLATAIQTAALKRGWNYILTDQASPLNVIVYGRTLVNMLGKDGNCEDVSKWLGNIATLTPDTSNKTNGTQGIVVTSTAASGSTIMSRPVTLDSTKYYVVLGDIKVGTAAAAQIALRLFGSAVVQKISSNATDNTKFLTRYTKVQPSDFTGFTSAEIRGIFTSTAIGQTAIFDSFRIYEISAADYAKIDVDPEWTGDKLAEKFPYVDGVKHLVNPAIAKIGKNMLPPFTEWGTIHANSSIVEPYKLVTTVNGTFQQSITFVSALPNTQYTYSFVGNTVYKIESETVDGTFLVQHANWNSASTFTFTTHTQAARIRIYVSNGNTSSGTYTVDKQQLELGSAATTFEPRNDDYLFLPVTLASNVDGSVRDQVFYRDGAWRKLKRLNEVTLDGSLVWAYREDGSGWKAFQTPIVGSTQVAGKRLRMATKFDGKVIGENTTGFSTVTPGYDLQYPNVADLFIISVADTDSGFGESYSPSASEMSNYFNGWKMCDASLAQYVSGTKYWTAVDSPRADFRDKVAGSTVANPHSAYTSSLNSLVAPSAYTGANELSSYANIANLDGVVTTLSTLPSGNIAQHMNKINLIEHVIRKYGDKVFGATPTDTASRVTWLKANISKISANWYGFGSGPSSTKGYLKAWDSSAWAGTSFVSGSTPSKLTFTLNFAAFPGDKNFVDANGFVYFLAHADASDGVTASTINTDYIDLEVYLAIQAVPAGYATTSYTPYKLTYQLAAAQEEIILHEGSISLHAGGNQVELFEGVIVREKANPVLSGFYYNINRVASTGSLLSKRNSKIINLYKNGVVEPLTNNSDNGWAKTADPAAAYGIERLVTYQAFYDPTAEYTVTYIVLDKYLTTANAVDVTGEYNTNPKTVQDQLVRRLADTETAVSVNVRSIAELYKRVKALGG